MQLDLHIHSHYSFDAESDTIEQLAQTAIKRKLSIIAITDHYEFFRKKKEQPEQFDVIQQQCELEQAQKKFDGLLTVLKGIEVGQPHAHTISRQIINTYAFDLVIGSLHAMPNDLDLYFYDYARINCDNLLREYFSEVLSMVEFGGFDILAHLDYPLRVMKLEDNYPSFCNYMEWITPILKEIIRRDIALEINAAGLFGWKKEVGPEGFILDEYRRLGGKLISIGSDSHTATSVGRGISACIAHAKAHGFHEVAVFKQRKLQQFSI